MFSMTYTGLVRPNLLKGTSAEWSEWVKNNKSSITDDNSAYWKSFEMNQQITGGTLILSGEVQLRDYHAYQGNSSESKVVFIYDSKNNLYSGLDWKHAYYSEKLTASGTYYISFHRTIKDLTIPYLAVLFQFIYASGYFRIRKIKAEVSYDGSTTPTPWCKHVDD